MSTFNLIRCINEIEEFRKEVYKHIGYSSKANCDDTIDPVRIINFTQ